MVDNPELYATLLEGFAQAQGLVTSSAFDEPGRRRRTIDVPEARGWLVVELVAAYKFLPPGIRGRVRSPMGSRMYDWHVEVAVEGLGVPIEQIVVVSEHGGVVERRPYLDWCRHRYDVISCGRCRQNILVVGLCPASRRGLSRANRER